MIARRAPSGRKRDSAQDRGESTADANWPGPGPLVCRGGVVGQPFEQPIVGGKEAALLVAEVLVEGLTRHRGAAGYLDDGGCVVALFCDRVDHRFEHALALRGADLFTRKVVASSPGGQSAAGRAGQNAPITLGPPAPF